jgi:hypothetical protein
VIVTLGAGPDDFSSSYRCVQRCISPQVNARHCDVRIARNNGMSTTIGASPSSHIAQNDTSLHRVNTCQRSRVGRSRADGNFVPLLASRHRPDHDAARYSGSTSTVHVPK